MSIKSGTLFFSDLVTGGTSNKQYSLQVEKSGSGYVVNYQYGPIGGTQNSGTRTPSPVSLEEATKIYDAKYREQYHKGYRPREGEVAAAPVAAPAGTNGARTPYPIEKLSEISDKYEATIYLESEKYWLQKKNDGEFRQIQKLGDGKYIGFNKLGGAINGLPQVIVYELDKIKAKTFFMSGELMGDHFIVENLLELDGKELTRAAYGTRFETLEQLIAFSQTKTFGFRHVMLTATWKTPKEKIAGALSLAKNRCEGEVYKLIAAPYRSGGSGHHKKYKYVKTISAVVTGKGHKGHNSATISLWDKGKLIEVGRVSLNGKENVEIGNVVEVRYLYATEGKRLYQPRLCTNRASAIRTDVNPTKCTTAQLIYKESVAV